MSNSNKYWRKEDYNGDPAITYTLQYNTGCDVETIKNMAENWIIKMDFI